MSHSEYAGWLTAQLTARLAERILELENTVEELSKRIGEVEAALGMDDEVQMRRLDDKYAADRERDDD